VFVFPRSLLYAAAVTGFAAVARAQDSLPRKLPPVVTVTRDVGRSPLDLPYSITSLRPDSLSPGQTHTFVEQTLTLLPGVTVANRTNPSQDTRISVRGFGARSAFGARSIRILRDGMPLTLPDGQTPIDYLDLESVGRVEVIRGTASALYGNASGGVIDIRSADAPSAPFALQARTWRGSSNLQRTTGLFGGTIGYNVQFSTAVFGVEGDMAWSGIKGSSSPATTGCAGPCETSNTWLGTARGRLGYAFDRFLPYVTAGAAFGEIKGTVVGGNSFTNTKVGWTAGLGMEYAFLGPWSAKLEYLYVDLGKVTCSAACSGAAPIDVTFTSNIIRAGVNYKF